MDAIIDALLLQARQGDVAAAKLLMQYTLGKPLEARDPDRLDADEVDAFRTNAVSNQALDLARLHPLTLFLPLFRILIDATARANLQKFADQFTAAFGPDGLSGPRCPERQVAPPPAEPTPKQSPVPQTAPPKDDAPRRAARATKPVSAEPAVSKGQETVPSP